MTVAITDGLYNKNFTITDGFYNIRLALTVGRNNNDKTITEMEVGRSSKKVAIADSHFNRSQGCSMCGRGNKCYYTVYPLDFLKKLCNTDPDYRPASRGPCLGHGIFLNFM